VKQRPVNAGGEPFALTYFVQKRRRWSASSLLGLTPNSLSLFAIWQLFYLERKPIQLPKAVLPMSATVKTVWGSTLPPIATVASGRLFAYGFIIKGPHFLWKQIHPPLIIRTPAVGLRNGTARSYCTPYKLFRGCLGLSQS
jgi:hypothetical protein